jgi:hypothetical protein
MTEPPELSCLIQTVKASQSFKTSKTTNVTKQRHIIEYFSNVAVKNSDDTASGMSENWTLFGLMNCQQLLKTLLREFS